MIFSMYRTDLPDWVKSEMTMTCPICGSYIVDNSDTGVTTARWCINPKCPGHMSFKADNLAKFFGVKDVGPNTLRRIIQNNNFTNHFQFIPRWFGDIKPAVTLPELASLACIDGYGSSKANVELGHYGSFEDYFSTCTSVNPLLYENKELLIEAESYFTLKPPVSAKKMLVMATGAFHNYSSRDTFFRLINEAYGMYINVIQTGKRKTGVSYLIKEKDAEDRAKSKLAIECHIPIVTPSEFISIIETMCPYINE